MRKVLVVAYYFPPMAASGSIRPLGFCRHLPAFGWAPHVLAADPGSLHPRISIDESLGARVPASVAVDRVRHVSVLRTAIQARDALFARAAREAAGPAPSTPPARRSRLREVKETVLDHAFGFPDQHAAWLRPAVRHASRRMRGEGFDAVFATGSPWTGLIAGSRIARRLGVPFIADFRDPWTRNAYGAWRPGVWQRARHLERAVCQEAAWVVANTDELRMQFLSDYPDLRHRFVTITNGFDDWMTVSGHTSVPGELPERAPEARELWHFGSIYGKRDPAALLTAVNALHQQGVLTAGRFRLRFVGSWEVADPATAAIADSLRQHGLLTIEPSIPQQECLRQMRGAPALLVIQPASPLQIPAKLYEYVAAGRPLLVVGGEGATAALVERHRLGRCCPNRVADLEHALREFVIEPDRRQPATSREALGYRHLTGRLAGYLDRAVSAEKRDRACA